jgi:hypothetical protein
MRIKQLRNSIDAHIANIKQTGVPDSASLSILYFLGAGLSVSTLLTSPTAPFSTVSCSGVSLTCPSRHRSYMFLAQIYHFLEE